MHISRTRFTNFLWGSLRWFVVRGLEYKFKTTELRVAAVLLVFPYKLALTFASGRMKSLRLTIRLEALRKNNGYAMQGKTVSFFQLSYTCMFNKETIA